LIEIQKTKETLKSVPKWDPF